MSLQHYIQTIATAENNSLANHQAQVCIHCSVFIKALDFSKTQWGALYQSAMLHDIGKLDIPDSILLKPKKLSPQEWEVMKLHPTRGAEIAENAGCSQQVIGAILCHHERWDGGGYPLGLKGEEIPLIARIIAVTDAYDAMTSNRPYRKALSHQDAINELVRCQGEQFDPWLVTVFTKAIGQNQKL